MGIPSDEFISLIPLVLLSIIYWFRDRYLFNRSPGVWWKATRVQTQVLVFLYPFWIFLTWTTGLQYRNNLTYALVSTTGSQVVGHLTSTGILNDSFLQTRQQVVSSVFGLMIAYVWTVYNHLTFSVGSDEVYDVEYNNCTCHNAARV